MQPPKPMRKLLKLDEIRLDHRLQSRVDIDLGVVDDYRDAIQNGERLPAISVVFDRVYYYLVDGWHRFHATRAAGSGEIEVDCLNGEFRDAKLASLAANGKHGLRRTNADKQKAIRDMLDDPEWFAWSDREIARHVGVSPTTVGTCRTYVSKLDSENSGTEEDLRSTVTGDEPRRYVTKHGIDAVMKTSNIGRDANPIRTRDTPIHSPSGDEDSWPPRSDEAASDHAKGGSETRPPISAVGGKLSDLPEPGADDDEFMREMNSLRDRISTLNREVDSLTATDTGAEIHRLSQLLLRAENAASDEKVKGAVREKSLKWFGKQFNELRQLLDVKNDRDVVTAVRLLKAMKRPLATVLDEVPQ